MNTAIFGPHVPSAWLPFAFSGSATVLTAVGVGGPEAVGAACLVGTITITLFGVLHYEVVRQSIIRQAQPEARSIQAEPDRPQPPAGWQAARAYDLKSHAVGVLMRKKVNPALPEFVRPGQMSRFAWGLLRNIPPVTLAGRAWYPGEFRKDSQYLPLIAFMRENDLCYQTGSNKPDQLTREGEAWLYAILNVYGPPPSAWIIRFSWEHTPSERSRTPEHQNVDAEGEG